VVATDDKGMDFCRWMLCYFVSIARERKIGGIGGKHTQSWVIASFNIILYIDTLILSMVIISLFFFSSHVYSIYPSLPLSNFSLFLKKIIKDFPFL
jgi:hypothetical protein